MHSTAARTHHDMLHICCGICGVKKNPHLVRKITPVLLEKIKSFSGYANYDITDERFPKVLCNEHYIAVHTTYSAKKPSEYKHKIPDKSPPFTEIELSFASTVLSTSGYKGDHTCFLCKQNKVGRPKRRVRGRKASNIPIYESFSEVVNL